MSETTQNNTCTFKARYTHTIPAGKYVIADPCYIFPDTNNQWITDFCNPMFEVDNEEKKKLNQKTDSYIGTCQGIDFLCFRTANGDGCYTFEPVTNAQLGVDAGLLAVIPFKLIEKWDSLKQYEGESTDDLFVITTFKEDQKLFVDNGNLYSNSKLVIDTECLDEEYEEYEEDEE
jgi:hypothetical protein